MDESAVVQILTVDHGAKPPSATGLTQAIQAVHARVSLRGQATEYVSIRAAEPPFSITHREDATKLFPEAVAFVVVSEREGQVTIACDHVDESTVVGAAALTATLTWAWGWDESNPINVRVEGMVPSFAVTINHVPSAEGWHVVVSAA